MTNRQLSFLRIILVAALAIALELAAGAFPASAQDVAATSPQTSSQTAQATSPGHRGKQATPTNQAPASTATGKEAEKIPGGSLLEDLRDFIATPATPGYEDQLAEKIRARLARYSPRTDSAGNIIVTIGAGAPHRVIAAPMDEPALVASGITDDGYLRVQRLPQNFPQGTYNSLFEAQPVLIGAPNGHWIHGVVAGLSVHLQPGREAEPGSDPRSCTWISARACCRSAQPAWTF